MYPKKRAISPVVSTIIITAATLLLVIGILAYSQNLFQAQTADAEYTQAQNIYVNLADEIDGVSARQGASAYVRINSRAGGPAWVTSLDNMTATINIIGQTAYGNVTVLNSNVAALQYRAGSQIGTSSMMLLRGTNASGVVNNQYPLGRVFTNQSKGALVQLDYDRVGIVDLGYQNVSAGIAPFTTHAAHTAFDYVDFVQLNLINLTFGGVHGGATYIAATDTNLTVNYYRINYSRIAIPYNTSYQVQVNVTRSFGVFTDTYTLNITTGSVFDGDMGWACSPTCGPTTSSTQQVPVDIVLAVIQPQVRIDFLGG